MTLPQQVTVRALLGFPEVREGDDIAELILRALQANEIHLLDGDILVVSSKIASKALGLRAPAGEQADVVLSQTVRIVAERVTASGVTRLVEAAAGPVMTAAGVDASNTGDESILLVLPADPDGVAAQIRTGVRNGWARMSDTHVLTGVILSDTAGRPWRIGQTDFALGSAGVLLVDDLRGSTDVDGRILSVTQRCVADEIAAAADLVKGKAAGVPVAHIRGLGSYVESGESRSGAKELIRTGAEDWFGYGKVEAVRSALGVEPGSARACEVGIPSLGPEDVATRAGRALRVALLTCPEASGRLAGGTIALVAGDDFTLGIAAARTEVALRGEGLTITRTTHTTPTHTHTAALMPTLTEVAAQDDDLTGHHHALIVFH